MIKLMVAIFLLVAAGCASTSCPRTYDVRYMPEAEIEVDGTLDEAHWNMAQGEIGFSFPWERNAAPFTEFRALCNERERRIIAGKYKPFIQ